jgi:hypothetical protein
MAITPTPVYPQTPKNGHVQILPADASGLKTLYTAGSNGSKITAVICSSTDTSARDVSVGVTRSAVFYALGTTTVAITAGTIAATAAQDMFTGIPGLPIDNDGQVYIFIESGDTFQVKSLTTVTAAKELDFNCIGADF